ncbi:MAG: AAA family ATPase [Candidatus Latescibacteria bacterium]|nr:AAA family ATPase [Candidatus Latescibacterota bacterium]
MEFSAPVTFFVGENGSGKSTLMESMAIGMEATTIGTHDIRDDPTLAAVRQLGDALRFVHNRRPKRGFFFRAEDAFGFTNRLIRERQELLDEERSLAEGIKGSGAEEAAAVVRAQRMQMEHRYGAEPDARSHGESFLHVLEERIVPSGLYLLDEPETPLSPMRQLALISLIKHMVKQDCQFIIATHSPILMAFPQARILLFENDVVRQIEYDEIEHVSITRAFLNNPEQILRHL